MQCKPFFHHPFPVLSEVAQPQNSLSSHFSSSARREISNFQIINCPNYNLLKLQIVHFSNFSNSKKNRKNIQPKLFATNGWIFAFEYLALVNAVLLRILQRLEALKTRENRHQKKFEIILSFGLSLLGILYPPERSLF